MPKDPFVEENAVEQAHEEFFATNTLTIDGTEHDYHTITLNLARTLPVPGSPRN